MFNRMVYALGLIGSRRATRPHGQPERRPTAYANFDKKRIDEIRENFPVVVLEFLTSRMRGSMGAVWKETLTEMCLNTIFEVRCTFNEYLVCHLTYVNV